MIGRVGFVYRMCSGRVYEYLIRIVWCSGFWENCVLNPFMVLPRTVAVVVCGCDAAESQSWLFTATSQTDVLMTPNNYQSAEDSSVIVLFANSSAFVLNQLS